VDQGPRKNAREIEHAKMFQGFFSWGLWLEVRGQGSEDRGQKLFEDDLDYAAILTKVLNRTLP